MTAITAPIQSKNRIHLIDGLRGFALFGILIAHMLVWFSVDPLPEEIWLQYQTGSLNHLALFLNKGFLTGKFYTFFSFLFGVSFALQLFRRKEGDSRFLPRFMWRLVLLLLIGIIHNLLWKGDILAIYAVLGFLLILFRKASNRALLAFSLILALNIPLLIHAGVQQAKTQVQTPATEAEMMLERQLEEAEKRERYLTTKSGSYSELIQMNMEGFPDKIETQFASGRIYVTLGFFLLGLWAGRKKLFEQVGAREKLFKNAIWVLLAANVALLGLFFAAQTLLARLNEPVWGPPVLNVLFAAHSAAMTVLYIAGMTLLLQKKSWRPVLQNLSAIGKMTLTNYLMQTVVGLGLFFSLGLGLMGELDPIYCLVIGVVVFGAQILFSRWWMTRFNYGPVEWLWRSATYLKWQPLVKTKPKEMQVVS